jgi:hypothetical protein
MKKQTSLKTIFVISILGMLFSGYLSWGELVAKSCYATNLGLGACTSVVGVPACVYGFFMYLIVFVISILGIRSKD